MYEIMSLLHSYILSDITRRHHFTCCFFVRQFGLGNYGAVTAAFLCPMEGNYYSDTNELYSYGECDAISLLVLAGQHYAV